MMHQVTTLPSHSSSRQRLYHALRSFLPSLSNLFWMILLIVLMSAVPNALGSSDNTNQTTTMPYTGYLTDENDSPLDGLYDMNFALYNQAVGGNPLWAENRSGAAQVQIMSGIFSIQLGNVTPIPQQMIIDNNELYLGISIGTDSEMSPRMPLNNMILDLYRKYYTLSNSSLSPSPAASQAIKQVDLDRPTTYPVSTTRYYIEATKAQVDNTVPLDMDIFNELCKDEDGCMITLGMRDWNDTKLGNVASRGPYHLFYSEDSTHWRLSTDIQGMDGNGTVQHILQAFDCYFTDAEYVDRKGTDNTVQLGLLNYRNVYNDPDMVCVLIIDD